MVLILIGVKLALHEESKPPKDQSSKLLIIKFIGYGFLSTLGISGILAGIGSPQLSIFTHLSMALGGTLAGSIGLRYTQD